MPRIDVTADVVAGAEALDTRTDELQAVVERAAKTATERGDEIDAVLSKIREVRTGEAGA
jgi:hypothetical protein